MLTVLCGLVAKDYILNHDHQEDRKVVGFLSIAVPHKGSLSAQILAPLNKNAQELVPLDEYVSRLNNEWMDKKGDLPESRYVIAAHDECVDKESALPGKIPNNKVFTVNHDHVSVCKPEGASDSVFKCATQLIDHVLKQKSGENSAAEVFDSSMPDYKKEIFIIKMIISDIGAKGIDNAKESFFQAEIVAKHSSIKERHQIFELQRRVVNLYRAIYNAHNETHDRNSVFSEVHQSIMEQDGAALKCGVEYVSYLHKQGLLHQAANQLTDEVIWGKDGDLDKVEALTK
ncbi:ABC-three component system protein [Azohydromonas lata]|uniref:ABC-three component system protein n=1 Tax=Azohydromonas lata TaxID=45677 RepID=A0ABU5IDN9_9BURK|nr:ABC-three component system protein [Azohydromonas lata]MDZ5456078.1 ABC-three component system protein [Azohydromonas lata]